MSAACQVADRAVRVPRCDRPEFIDALLGVCLQDHVDLIVPTIDPELEPLSAHADRFREVGTDVAVSAPAVVRLARDKLRTAHFLASHGLPVPRSALPQEVLSEPHAWPWPLMVKPRAGSSSVGIRIVSSPDATGRARRLAGVRRPGTAPGRRVHGQPVLRSGRAPALRDPAPALRGARRRGGQGHHAPARRSSKRSPGRWAKRFPARAARSVSRRSSTPQAARSCSS